MKTSLPCGLLHSDAATPQRVSRTAQSSTRTLLCLAIFLTIPLTAGISQGQQRGFPTLTPKDLSAQNPGPINNRNRDPGGAQETGLTPAEEQKRLVALNALRHKEMSADTEKLLALATQLKAAMDKTDKDTLSLDVVKKAEQIEKLAKSVKQKMKASLGN